MTDRRSFLAAGGAALASLSLPLGGAARLHALATNAGLPHEPSPHAVDANGIVRTLVPPAVDPDTLARDERYWARVREGYALDPAVINLDHGWMSPPPRLAVDALVASARALAALPAAETVRIWEEVTTTVARQAIAGAMGVAPTEIALVRNATEALDTVLLGLPLSAGDEIVCSSHDYYSMLDALEQRRARDGVVLRMVQPPVPAPSLDALAELYEAEIGPRTKLVLLTHPSNITGQMLPARRIAAAAHAVGAEVVVDGAQSLGLIEDPVASLDCDYYGASAHKWLGVPIGMGILWMRPEHVTKVWPLVPPPPRMTGMARFEWIGTVPDVGPAVMPSLAMHDTIGVANKAARLRYLTGHWRRRAAAALPNARFHSTDDAEMTCGLCTIALPGADPYALQARLLRQHRTLVQVVGDSPRTPGLAGVRVTPNVYTSLSELNRLVAALVAVQRA